MADQIIILDSENLVVAGGINSVTVETDLGSQGNRGSLILYGNGDPNLIPIFNFPQTPKLLDWYINLDTSDPNYLYIYQYISKDGSISWDKLFKIIPNIYSTTQRIAFGSSNVASISILVANTTLPLLANTSPSRINAHINLQADDGSIIASSFEIGQNVISNNSFVLPITVTAVKQNSSSLAWSKVTNQSVTAHITVSVI
jgi:hypothetical protein